MRSGSLLRVDLWNERLTHGNRPSGFRSHLACFLGFPWATKMRPRSGMFLQWHMSLQSDECQISSSCEDKARISDRAPPKRIRPIDERKYWRVSRRDVQARWSRAAEDRKDGRDMEPSDMVRCSSLEDPKFEAGKCALEAEGWRASRTARGCLHACATDLPLWLMVLDTSGGMCLPLMIFGLLCATTSDRRRSQSTTASVFSDA